MKKALLFNAVVLSCMFLAPTFFCACDRNEEEITQKKDPKKEDPVPVKASLSITLEISQDVLNLCDVVIKYDDSTGEKTREMTEVSNSVNIIAGLPATFNVKVEATLKEGASLEGIDHVSITRNIRYSYHLLTADEKQIEGRGGSKTSETQLAVGGDRFAEYITDGRYNKEFSVRLDSKGNLINE